MTILDTIARRRGNAFSFEVLPPLRGRNIESLFDNIRQLIDFGPTHINVTTHRSEQVFKSTADGLYRKVSERTRPGTVAVAASIQNKFSIPAVPHMICSGFTRSETEYALIDLSFLGINNLLLLRGDKASHESQFTPSADGHRYAIELQQQVNQFNRGLFIDGTAMDLISDTPFSYGVAGYPEKHEEAPNSDVDLERLKAKVDAGASYVVTQMFFDNNKYFDFVERARRAGITVPIIPGIKPIVSTRQLTLLPKVFSVDIPTDLAAELSRCGDDNARAKDVGVEWCAMQARELLRKGAPSVHFYSHNATQSVRRILTQIF